MPYSLDSGLRKSRCGVHKSDSHRGSIHATLGVGCSARASCPSPAEEVSVSVWCLPGRVTHRLEEDGYTRWATRPRFDTGCEPRRLPIAYNHGFRVQGLQDVAPHLRWATRPRFDTGCEPRQRTKVAGPWQSGASRWLHHHLLAGRVARLATRQRLLDFPSQVRSAERSHQVPGASLYEKSFNLKIISQGDFGHF